VVKVHVVHRRWNDDRVLARFARHLAARLGWGLGRQPERWADVDCWLAYDERGRFETSAVTRQAAYITHVDDPELEPDMVRLHHETAALVDLRVCMNRVDRDALAAGHGPTVAPPPPVELGHVDLERKPPRPVRVIGFSGYGYRSGRKGGDPRRRAHDHLRGARLGSAGGHRTGRRPARRASWCFGHPPVTRRGRRRSRAGSG
jgi:hypothetical protein